MFVVRHPVIFVVAGTTRMALIEHSIALTSRVILEICIGLNLPADLTGACLSHHNSPSQLLALLGAVLCRGVVGPSMKEVFLTASAA